MLQELTAEEMENVGGGMAILLIGIANRIGDAWPEGMPHMSDLQIP